MSEHTISHEAAPAQSAKKGAPYKRLLLTGIIIAVAVYVITGGRFLNVRLIRQTVKHPTDKEENLIYEQTYQPLSDLLLERDGIVLKNTGETISALDLESGITVDAGGIAERSSAPIRSFSEYVGYIYMFDGTDVYARAVNSGKLKAIALNCLKFVPSGNYVYYLRDEKGVNRLYRCNINGAYEKLLFSEEIRDFRACDGNLLLFLADNRTRWYDTVTQNSLEHVLPADAAAISLTDTDILYLSDGSLYARPFERQEDTALAEDVALFHAGFGHIAILHPDGRISLTTRTGGAAADFSGPAFSADCSLSISSTRLYVTDLQSGETWFTPLSSPAWEQLSF